ncbi:MAG: hypothetical protein K8T20_20435 [Planctomycetes bacterium]|nr:hypothetical protein [Planctomycetota bacterium]
MKRIIAVVAVLAISLGSGLLFAEEPARRPAVPVDEITPEAGDKNLKTVPAEQKQNPGPDETNLRNSEWRGLLHSANQVREAAMTIMVLAVTLFAVLVLGALVVFTAGIAPNAVARTSVVTRDHPIRSFVVGAVALAFGSMFTIATKGVLGIIFAPVLTSALLIGLAGVSEHLGRNLCHLSGKEGNRIGHIAAGWTTFSLVSVVPLVGWFGFFPYYCAVGVGAFFSSLRGGRKTTEAYDRA